MPAPIRWTALWLSVASLGAGAAFLSLWIRLFPDFYSSEWVLHTGALFLIGATAGRTFLRPPGWSWWTIAFLAVGHIAAAINTHEYLGNRIQCINISQAVEYWIPFDTGALLLFGPSFALLVVSAMWRSIAEGARRHL